MIHVYPFSLFHFSVDYSSSRSSSTIVERTFHRADDCVGSNIPNDTVSTGLSNKLPPWAFLSVHCLAARAVVLFPNGVVLSGTTVLSSGVAFGDFGGVKGALVLGGGVTLMPPKLAARSSTIVSISIIYTSIRHEYVPGFSPASESLDCCTGVIGLVGLVSAFRDHDALCPVPLVNPRPPSCQRSNITFPARLACPSKILFPAFRSVNFCVRAARSARMSSDSAAML